MVVEGVPEMKSNGRVYEEERLQHMNGNGNGHVNGHARTHTDTHPDQGVRQQQEEEEEERNTPSPSPSFPSQDTRTHPPTPTHTNNPKYKYLLQAVIVHHGSADSGHYTVYRRLSPLPPSHLHTLSHPPANTHTHTHTHTLLAEEINGWVHVSDESVVPAKVEEVLDAEAYMLFYQSIESLKEGGGGGGEEEACVYVGGGGEERRRGREMLG